MAVRIDKLEGARDAASVALARVSITVAPGVWLTGIHVISGATGPEVVFPSIVGSDARGVPRLEPALEFASSDVQARWVERILAEYAGRPAPSPEPAPRAASPAPPPATAIAPRATAPVPEAATRPGVPEPAQRAAAQAPEPGLRITAPPASASPTIRPVAAPAPAADSGPPAGRVYGHFDGASRGNPGMAASAVVLELRGHDPIRRAIFLGEETNNVAEYQAVRLALEEVLRLKESGQTVKDVVLKGDSLLVVKQLGGEWKIKDPTLADLADDCRELVRKLGVRVRFEHVPRERNRDADRLANECLDRGEDV